MALAALLDREWMFSGAARWGGWVCGLVLAIVAARSAAGRVCPGSSDFAKKVESGAGESAPVVSTTLDPSVREAAARDEFGQEMLGRLDQRALDAVRKAPPEFKGRLKVPLALLFAAVAGVYAVASLQDLQGLQRMLLPWEHSPYTTLVLEGPGEPVAEGQAFELSATVSGVRTGKVAIYSEDGQQPLAEAEPDADGRVKFTMEGRDKTTVFIAKAGDGQSDPLPFEPYLLPRIQSFEISVTHPGYGDAVAKTETRPSFSVFRGSLVNYRIHLAAPAAKVTVSQDATPNGDERITEEERKNLVRGAYGVMVGKADAPVEAGDLPGFRPSADDPLVWEAQWEFPSPGAIVYRLTIEGERGDLVHNDEPWRINILHDAPPEIHIDHHNGEEVIELGNETVQFGLRAADDIGLGKIHLVFRKPGQPYQEKSITLPPGNHTDWTGSALLDLAPLDLSPLDIVAVHAEVEDTNTMDGPGLGRSEVVFLEVPFPESDDDGGGGGGGEGGGGSEPINPLQLQMEILKSTMALGKDSPAKELVALAHDQRQNAGYTAKIEGAASGPGLEWLASALWHAKEDMEKAARFLDNQSIPKAIPEEESALGSLVEAAKLMDEAVKKGCCRPNAMRTG